MAAMISWMMVFMVFSVAWLDLLLFMVGQWSPISYVAIIAQIEKRDATAGAGI